ncbi:Translation machinery associated TMA7 [Plasmodiophora brassicae]|uniref:Translation machinery associated TMA7 n=1 Tax=Plasmodiophora brassicae TaxID=37360 RepID=A0A0G4J6B2_PLABS|nr:hypothetical protein PBRA_009300 [Plasmodiophora brassicae]
MSGKAGGKKKPLKQAKAQDREYTDEDKAFLKKKQEEAAALKKAKSDLQAKGKKK